MLTTGQLRINDARTSGLRRVLMRAVCCTVPKGAALRLSIQAAAWPAFAVNPGTGARLEEAHGADALVTTLRIAHGASAPSCPLLPVPE